MTATSTDTIDLDERSRINRLRASPFLQQLWSNRLAMIGVTIIVAVVIIGVYARIFIDLNAIMKTSYGTNPQLSPPTAAYPFGTDVQARDIFPRVLYGAWFALKFGGVTVLASTAFGISLGVIAAYYGGFVDSAIMRLMDVLLAFPTLLLALAFVAMLGTGLWKAVLALTLVYTPRFARVVRGASLTVLENEYIDATQALGATDFRVLVRHVIPNCLAPIMVQSSLNFGLVIINLAALSFLGFGAEAGTPTWGLILSNGVDGGLLTGKWWWSFFPGLFLSITVLGFNLLGDGMRDALDPRMREVVD